METNSVISENVGKAIDSAVETILVPMEKAIGPYAIPARKAGNIAGDAIIKGIDKLVDKFFD